MTWPNNLARGPACPNETILAAFASNRYSNQMNSRAALIALALVLFV
jgi:hypothetical protein